MTEPITGVILAGGSSRRMGHNKALLELDGRPLIAIIAERLRQVADEIVIAANDCDAYRAYGDRCAPDHYSGMGTLAGIHAGLSAARHDLAFVVGCDMPFVNPTVIAWLMEHATGYDVTILQHADGIEPLHAAYRKSCLGPIAEALEAGKRRAYAFHEQVRVRYVSPAEIAHLDPELRSFRNLNTPEEWREALRESPAASTPGDSSNH